MRRALSKGMNAYLATAKRRSVPLKDLGVDVSMVLALITEAKDQVKEEDFRGGARHLGQAAGPARRPGAEATGEVIGPHAVTIAHRQEGQGGPHRHVKPGGGGAPGPGEGDMPLAVQKVEESDRELNHALAGYQEVEAELVEFRNVSERARTLGLNVDDATRTVALARRAALRQDFASAASLLRDSKKDVQTAIQEHYGKIVIRIELDLGLAMRIGADVAADSEALDGLVHKVKQNEFGIVEAELKELAQDIKQKIDRPGPARRHTGQEGHRWLQGPDGRDRGQGIAGRAQTRSCARATTSPPTTWRNRRWRPSRRRNCSRWKAASMRRSASSPS